MPTLEPQIGSTFWTLATNPLWLVVASLKRKRNVFCKKGSEINKEENNVSRVSYSNYSYSNYSNILRYSNLEYFWPNIRTIRILKKSPFWAKYYVLFREIDWNSIKICQKKLGFYQFVIIIYLLYLKSFQSMADKYLLIRMLFEFKQLCSEDCLTEKRKKGIFVKQLLQLISHKNSGLWVFVLK